MPNMDQSSLSVSETMFKRMIIYVETYRVQQKGRNPMIVYLDSEQEEWVSFPIFEQMFTYYTENNYPIIIPIQTED